MSIFTCICTLFLSYNLAEKPRTSNQNVQMLNPSVRISKHKIP